MNTLRTLISVVVFVSSIISPAFANDQESKINQIMEVTGITSQVENIPELLGSVFAQQKNAFQDAQYIKILEIIDHNFSQRNFRNLVFSEINDNYNANYTEYILGKYKEELFIKITETENNFHFQDNIQKINSLDLDSADQDKIALLNSYISNAHIIEYQKIVTTESIKTFISTINLFLPKEKKISAEVEQSILENSIKQLDTKANRNSIIKQYMLTYENYSTDELRTYLAFYETNEGKWLNNCYLTGIQKGFEKAMNASGLQMISEFGLGSSI